MTFTFTRILDHGVSNPIVARLHLQTLQILEHCKIDEDVKQRVTKLYLNTLSRKLLRCWEIKERFRSQFNAAVEAYKTPKDSHFPHILRLEEECHNFLYEIKNYIRDLLKVFNLLYGTNFKEASEFSRPKKRSKSLVEFASQSFGLNDPKTKFLGEAVEGVEYFIDLRNAAEHPGGYSGELIITNFTRDPDGKAAEPDWVRVRNGVPLYGPSSIRADMDAAIHNFLQLGEDILVSWAAENLRFPEFTQVAVIPEESRDPKRAIKYVVAPNEKLEQQLSKLPRREGG
jgi:hypothetical protein